MENLLLVWLIIQLCAFGTLPLTMTLCAPLADRGYGLSKTLGFLLIGFVVWLVASLHLATFSPFTIICFFILICSASWFWYTRQQGNLLPPLQEYLRTHWTTILWVEGIFLATLLTFAWIRGFAPMISGTEKLMDFAFMNGIAQSTFFPPHDPWFAGETINYYYFGHYLMAFLQIASGIPMRIIYNIGLALVFALSFINLFAIGFNGTILYTQKNQSGKAKCGGQEKQEKKVKSAGNSKTKSISHQEKKPSLVLPLVTGIALAFAVLIGGNSDPLLHMLHNANRTINDSWWGGIGWNASRVIGRGFKEGYSYTDSYSLRETLQAKNQSPDIGYITINEFPYFSFILGDMHAHVINLMLVTLCIGVILSLMLRKPRNTHPGNSKEQKTGISLKTQLATWLHLAFTTPGSHLDSVERKPPPHTLHEALISLLLSAIVLGSIAATNLWDFPIWGFVLFIALIVRFGMQTIQRIQTLILATTTSIVVGILSIILYLPFFLSFTPIKATAPTEQAWQDITAGVSPILVALATPFRSFLVQPIISIEQIGRRTEFLEFLVIWGSWILLASIAFIILKTYPMLTNQNSHQTSSPHKSAQQQPENKKTPPPTTILLTAIGIGSFIIGLLTTSLTIATLICILGLLVVSLTNNIFRKKQHTVYAFAQSSLLVGFILITVCEFIFLNDHFGPPSDRMNTVFKLYYQAWILVGTGSMLLIAAAWHSIKEKQLPSIVLAGIIILILGSSASYAFIATPAKIRDAGGKFYGLDGLGHLANSQDIGARSDVEASEWLLEHADEKSIIVETVEDEQGRNSYSDRCCRIAAYTGYPSLVGWYSSHENLWRNQDPEIGERIQATKTIYTANNPQILRQLINQYKITHIYVGSTERAVYPDLDTQIFTEVGTLVYRNEASEIYAVTPE